MTCKCGHERDIHGRTGCMGAGGGKFPYCKCHKFAMPQTNGHRCQGARRFVKVSCECGWESGMWGATCQASAYSEWHAHVAEHRDQGAKRRTRREAA